jgi:hypothetical protein
MIDQLLLLVHRNLSIDRQNARSGNDILYLCNMFQSPCYFVKFHCTVLHFRLTCGPEPSSLLSTLSRFFLLTLGGTKRQKKNPEGVEYIACLCAISNITSL